MTRGDPGEIDRIAVRYADAAYRKDEAAFLALYDERVVVYDMWERWIHHGRDAWARAVREWFGSLGDDRVAVSFVPTMARISGDAAAWCAIVRYAAVDPAGVELRSMENRMSWSLVRGTDGWAIVHEHSSAPASPDTLAVSLRLPDGERSGPA